MMAVNVEVFIGMVYKDSTGDDLLSMCSCNADKLPMYTCSRYVNC